MAVKFQCPFCGLRVDLEDEQFRWVTITNAEGFAGKKDAPVQDFPSHQRCLEMRLGNEFPIL